MEDTVSFIKMHGAGNDFVILDLRIHDVSLTPIAITNICDRHFGVGCDQLITLSKPKHKEADCLMSIYNSDGSMAASCGNATRCVAALILADSGQAECIIETKAGLRSCWIEDDGFIYVDMSKPILDDASKIPIIENIDPANIPLNMEEISINPMAIGLGNPHAVFIVDDISAIDIKTLGPKIEHHPVFPEQTNVEFVQILDDQNIRMRVWERGVGITFACGSGACASAIAAIIKKQTKRKLDVHVDGGTLKVQWCAQTGHVILSGPIAISFGGSLSPSLWNERA